MQYLLCDSDGRIIERITCAETVAQAMRIVERWAFRKIRREKLSSLSVDVRTGNWSLIGSIVYPHTMTYPTR